MKVNFQILKKEYRELKEASDNILSESDPLYKALYEINLTLWDIEDKIRDLERRKDFGKNSLRQPDRSTYPMTNGQKLKGR